MAKVKTEHAGAKNGGGHWGTRSEAKTVSKRKRRQADTATVQEELEQLALEQAKDLSTRANRSREVSLRDSDQGNGAPAKRVRVNKGDDPRGWRFHEETGLLLSTGPANAWDTDPEVKRMAREAAVELLHIVTNNTALQEPPLNEVRALHRALFPGWQTTLKGYLKYNAIVRAEGRARATRTGHQFRTERAEISPQNMLVNLRAPQGLTVEIVRALDERVRLGAGGDAGSLTAEKAVELAELAVVDMAKFKRALKQKRDARDTRRSKRRSS